MMFNEDTKSLVFGLAYGCPYQDEERDCPFSMLRTMPFSNRVSMLNELPTTVIEKYYDRHKNCAANRETAARARTADSWQTQRSTVL